MSETGCDNPAQEPITQALKALEHEQGNEATECDEYEIAINLLEEALAALRNRTRRMEEEG